jgi:DNA-binding transcriptional LysR family regulator
MELRQLIYFEAVARCGGFTPAADRLRIAQPAVSAQIRNLERELGTKLFERTTRRVTLTHAGELLLTRVRAVLAELDRARADLDQLDAVLRGQLRIGVTPVLGSLDLPAALAGFHRRYPELAVTVRTGLIAELLHVLDAGEVDIVLGPIHDDLADRYSARRLVDETLVLITPPDQVSTMANADTLAAHRDEPFVCSARRKRPERHPDPRSGRRGIHPAHPVRSPGPDRNSRAGCRRPRRRDPGAISRHRRRPTHRHPPSQGRTEAPADRNDPGTQPHHPPVHTCLARAPRSRTTRTMIAAFR